MFGKGGGALSAWIKEFCQLVFIQTLQAFIYAVAIGMIMKINFASLSEQSDRASGLGFLCVIMLLSIFKVEDIARRIFGFGPTKADHNNAVKSIAKTAFAMKIGKRVLDNGKKFVGGVGKITKANKDALKAKSRFEKQRAALDKDNGSAGSTPSSLSSPTQNSRNSASESRIRNEIREKERKKKEAFENAMRAKKEAFMKAKQDGINSLNTNNPAHQKYLQGYNDYMQEAVDYGKEIRGLNEKLESGDTRSLGEASGISQPAGNSSTSHVSSSAGSGAGSGSGGRIKDYHQRLLNYEETYSDKLSEIKKNRRQGVRDMTKGIVETGGAVIGGTAGAILAGADGNFDEAAQGLVAGAGLGDAAGEFAVDTVFNSSEFVEKHAKDTSSAIKDLKKNITEAYEEEQANAQREIADIDKEARRVVKNLNDEADSLAKNSFNSPRTNSSSMAIKAAMKGSKKTYNSRHGGIRQLDNSIKDLKKSINEMEKNNNKYNNDVESID